MITCLISPSLFEAGLKTSLLTRQNVDGWNSIYTGISMIVNRLTPEHTDSRGIPAGYDLLLSAGNASAVRLQVTDLDLCLDYNPGCFVALAGKALAHRVGNWDKEGERICVAYFMHDRVLQSVGTARATFPTLSDLCKLK